MSDHISDFFAVKWTEALTAVATIGGLIGGIFSYRARTKEIKHKNTLDNFSNYLSLNAEFETKNRGILRVRDASEKLDDCYKSTKVSEFHGILIYELPGGHEEIERRRSIWSSVTDDDRYEFLTFYERIALMLQSDLITPELAFYVYGVELIRTYEIPEFWISNNKPDDKYWQLTTNLFKAFKDLDRLPTFENKSIRL